MLLNNFISHWNEIGTKEVGIIENNATNTDKYWRGRKDSNPQPSDPKSD
ncbi:uncharacterized protein METZ01_LOCUS85621, partial [marine metagenome]